MLSILGVCNFISSSFLIATLGGGKGKHLCPLDPQVPRELCQALMPGMFLL
jgi:hypothetical protein